MDDESSCLAAETLWHYASLRGGGLRPIGYKVSADAETALARQAKNGILGHRLTWRGETLSSRPPPLRFGATGDWIEMGFDGVSPYRAAEGVFCQSVFVCEGLWLNAVPTAILWVKGWSSCQKSS
jgi:hypothetical protein